MSYVGYVYLLSSCERRGIEAYSAWASALLVQHLWAMQEPRIVGRVTSTDSHASFYASINGPLNITHHEWELVETFAQ